MIDSSSMSNIAGVNANRVDVFAVAGPDPMHPPPVWLSCGLKGRAEVLGQAFEVQDPTDQVGLLPHPGEPAATERRRPCQSFPSPKSSSINFRHRWDMRYPAPRSRMRTRA